MASTYKTFLSNDIASTKTLLHEAIPITGTIVSGTSAMVSTYGDENIKEYTHGMFQSVYDYPYISSSANHIFDITCGYSDVAGGLSSSDNPQNAKKINIYNQFAQVLVPYDVDGNIQRFDADGNVASTDDKMDTCVFLTFSRLLAKDEIKKGSFRFKVATTGSLGKVGRYDTIGDYGAATNYKVTSPTGEFGILYRDAAAASDSSGSNSHNIVGHIYYQAGVVVITGGLWQNLQFSSSHQDVSVKEQTASLTYQNSTIDEIADAVRFVYDDLDFNNTTELNSTIYFCRANTADYNYSSNPTYLTSASKIRVKGNNSFEEPVSYLTTVGLYSADNELLAVAKISEPLKKTPSNELTLRVRLDY